VFVVRIGSAIVCLVLALAVSCLTVARAGHAVDPGRLPQTRALPSSKAAPFRRRMIALWRGIVTDSVAAAVPAFFPRAAYLQVKQIANPPADYDNRLLAAYRADIGAAHRLLARGVSGARLLFVSVPREWAWIPPGYCYNRIGYWHAPGARLVYREKGRIHSFGIFSFISWRGQWYVIHLARFDQPGTVDAPALGLGQYGRAGGC
jgi:hypothetical protein